MNWNLLEHNKYKKDIFNKLKFDYERGKRILDVGCGDGSDAKIFIEEYGLETFGIDIYEHENIKRINGLKFQKATILNIPYNNNSFDYVFLHDVLHHIDEKNQSYEYHTKGLTELNRICKREGYIIIVEGNRLNPLFYPHMVIMKKHNHFRQSYFKKIIEDVFNNVQFSFFECHLYPPKFLWFWKIYEKIMESVHIFKPFLSYNVAIIKNDK